MYDLGKKRSLRKCENKLFPPTLSLFTPVVIGFMWGTFKKYVFLKYLLIGVELCDFVLEHLTISRFNAGNSYSISLSNSRFLELFEVNKLVKKEKDCSTCSILDFSFKVFLAWFDSSCVLICLVLYYICLAPAEWSYVILGCPGYCFSVHTLGFLMTFLFDLEIQLSLSFVMLLCFVQFMIPFSLL